EAEPPQTGEAQSAAQETATDTRPQPPAQPEKKAKRSVPIVADPAFCALADCSDVDLEPLLFALGYRRHGSADGQAVFVRKGPRKQSDQDARKDRGKDGRESRRVRARKPQQEVPAEGAAGAADERPPGEARKPRRPRGRGKAPRKAQSKGPGKEPSTHHARDSDKQGRKPLDQAAIAARKARQEEARRREEKRMADSPFAILKQLSFGGE
ncbi:MAG: hypothetical protein RLN99_00725, partial [Kiloniellaceae bacterium]